jgi:uncharacterized protein (TIGR00251 family)
LPRGRREGRKSTPAREAPGGVEIDVRIIPRAASTGIGGVRDGALLVRVAAPPVEGAANEALIDFFADLFDLPRRAIRIVRGEHSRRKRIAIDGVTLRVFRDKIPAR